MTSKPNSSLSPLRGERGYTNDRFRTANLDAFVAEDPEHRHDCCRVIRPGQTYFLTIEWAVVCPERTRATDAIRLTGGLIVEVRENGLLVRRASSEVEVLPHGVRHLVDALVLTEARHLQADMTEAINRMLERVFILAKK